MIRYRRTSLCLVLLAAQALPALISGRAAASSPAPALPLPPATFFPPLRLHPTSALDHRIFTRAAARSGVPLSLLLAVSYVQSHWSDHGGRPTIDDGYGLMDLVHTPERDTLHAAARLLGVPPGRVAHEDTLNVLGGALLLARAARALSPHHRLPRTLGGWAAAVVWLTGMRTRLAAEALLREVYGLLAHGVALPGRLGRADWSIGIGRLHATPGAVPDLRTLAPLLPPPVAARAGGADYRGAIWAPSPNYTPAHRPVDLRVSYAVIHDTEGSCAAALNWLDGSASGSSAHFLVCQDGTVYQLVHMRDVAWHAGNWYVNQHSIGIEHEGFRDSGGYTQAQYDASAALVRWLDRVYGLHIQLDRNAIFGHDNVPDGGHTDPGPQWNWSYYMSRLRGGAPYDGGNPSVAIVVAPEALFHDCPDPSCRVEGSADWGEQFALARTAGGWDEVYYNGHATWVNGAAVAAGAGTRLRVAPALLPVRAEPSSHSHVMGAIARGQVYVSRLLDRSPDRGHQGWWLIAYNHRYGFINCSHAPPIGQSLPPGCAAAPAATGRTPALCGAAAPLSTTATATAALTLTTPPLEIVEPATTTTSTGAVTPTATTMGSIATMTGAVPAMATVALTGTASPQAGTPTATPTVTPLTAATGMASMITTGTVTAAETSTATATAPFMPTPTPTSTPTSTVTPTPTPTVTVPPSPSATVTVPPSPSPSATATPPQLSTLDVSLSRPYAGLGQPLRLCVHANVGRAPVRYRLDLPVGVALRASGRTDAQGNAQRTFILPGKRWLADVLRRAVRRPHGRGGMPRVPHSLAAVYAVSVTWHGHTMSRRGGFRIVLWDADGAPVAARRPNSPRPRASPTAPA